MNDSIFMEMRKSIITACAIACTLLTGAVLGQTYPIEGSITTKDFTGPVTGRKVEYRVYLPADYNSSAKPYPVLYHLHGAGMWMGSDNTATTVAHEKAVKEGVCAPMVIVFPSAAKYGMWADKEDSTVLSQTHMIRELIPHVEKTYKVLKGKQSRAIGGMSMGGFGALMYGAKYPDSFAVVVGYDGAYLNWQDFQSKLESKDPFFPTTEAHFEQNSPWYWSERNAAKLRTGVKLRMVVGSLHGFNRSFRDHLKALDIPVDYKESGCDHQLSCMHEKYGVESMKFISDNLMTATTGLHQHPRLNAAPNASISETAASTYFMSDYRGRRLKRNASLQPAVSRSGKTGLRSPGSPCSVRSCEDSWGRW